MALGEIMAEGFGPEGFFHLEKDLEWTGLGGLFGMGGWLL